MVSVYRKASSRGDWVTWRLSESVPDGNEGFHKRCKLLQGKTFKLEVAGRQNSCTHLHKCFILIYNTTKKYLANIS